MAGLTWKIPEMLGSHVCHLVGPWGLEATRKPECAWAPGDLTRGGKHKEVDKQPNGEVAAGKQRLQQKKSCTVNSELYTKANI